MFSAKMILKRFLPLLLAILLCTGCEFPDIKQLLGKAETSETSETNDPNAQPQEEQVQKLNGVSIEEYVIVYSDADPDYSLRAAVP